MGISQVFSTIFKVGLFLAAVGLLPRATVWLESEALKANHFNPVGGFVSYRTINYRLIGKQSH